MTIGHHTTVTYTGIPKKHAHTKKTNVMRKQNRLLTKLLTTEAHRGHFRFLVITS